MKWVKLIPHSYPHGQIYIVQAENDKGKIMDLLLDNLSKCKTDDEREGIKKLIAAIEADPNAVYIEKNQKPVPYDEVLHSNLFK